MLIGTDDGPKRAKHVAIVGIIKTKVLYDGEQLI
jgi:hypothetical protein